MLLLVVVVLVGFVAAAGVSTGEERRPPKRFLVVTQPRSGSTWFVKYSAEFAKLEGVVTLGEVMHPEMVERKSPEILGRVMQPTKIDDYMKYLRGVYRELAQGIGWRGDVGVDVASEDAGAFPPPRVIGFKLMYHQLPSASGNGVPIAPGARGLAGNITLDALVDFCASKNILVIHLHRANQLERFITLTSMHRYDLAYHQNGTPTSYSTLSNTDKKIRRVNISDAEAFAFAHANTRANYLFDKYLRDRCLASGARCLSLLYEQLTGDNAKDLFGLIRRHLGLRDFVVEQETTRRWVSCKDRVENWDEISTSKRLHKTVWLAMCRNGNAVIPPKDLYGNYSEFVSKRAIKAIDANLRGTPSHDTTLARLIRKITKGGDHPPPLSATKQSPRNLVDPNRSTNPPHAKYSSPTSPSPSSSSSSSSSGPLVARDRRRTRRWPPAPPDQPTRPLPQLEPGRSVAYYKFREQLARKRDAAFQEPRPPTRSRL